MNKHLKKLQELPGAVVGEHDIFAFGIRTPSPSVNFIFGNTHLLPFGYSAIFWGPPKGGKTVLCNSIIGQLHKDDPEALAIKFNTEMRERGQLNPNEAGKWGIDLDRYLCFDTNLPEEIFDYIEYKIAELCEAGAKVKLIVIDSITDIAGRRSLNATTVNQQQIGDEAATIQAGLKRIRRTLRKYGIALILTAHERAELDQLEQMRGNKTKMAGAYYLKHFAEYFIYIARNRAKDGKTDLSGEKFELDNLKDIDDNPEKFAIKIKAKMVDSSMGVNGRGGEFTLDFYKGIVNTHEEVFRLGVTRGVFERPNNRTYVLPNWPSKGIEAKWTSFDDCLTNVKNNDEIQKEIVKRVKEKDIEMHRNGVLTDRPEAPLFNESTAE